jgi:diguanylate cyclase (GGDEF)-like protein
MTRQRLVFIISIIIVLLIGYYDFQTGAHISMMLLYSVPILLSAWYCGRTDAIVVAVIAAASWFIVIALNKPPGASDAILSWNAFTRLAIFALIAYIVSLQAHLRRALDRAKLSAETDSLTGLLNESAFRERVDGEMKRSWRYNHPLSLAYIDLDDFKQVNDSQGHARGDKLLRQVTETITRTIRKTDFAGRVGGDEFAICFPETGEEQVRKAVEALVKAMDIMTSQSGWQVTASIGVVTCRDICETYDALLGEADRLMYVAKEKGKNAAEFAAVDATRCESRLKR